MCLGRNPAAVFQSKLEGGTLIFISKHKFMRFLDCLRKPKRNSGHHYRFAHQALRKVAFAEPVRIFDILASTSRAGFFDELLCELDAAIQDDGHRNFTGSDIRFSDHAVDGRPCAVLRMPPTRNPTEAYFIAIVSRLPLDQLSSRLHDNTSETLIDYYTLERPAQVARKWQSVFCAWTGNGRHLNFGAGPRPWIRRFVPFLTRYIRCR